MRDFIQRVSIAGILLAGIVMFANAQAPITVNPALGLRSATQDFTCTAAGVCTVAKVNNVAITGAATATWVADTAWTPADNSGAGLTFTGVSARYNRIGSEIFVYAQLTYPVTASGATSSISGLPVNAANANFANAPCSFYQQTGIIGISVGANSGNLSPLAANGTNLTNATLSTATLRFACHYPAA